jgi:hypothetical protein
LWGISTESQFFKSTSTTTVIGKVSFGCAWLELSTLGYHTKQLMICILLYSCATTEEVLPHCIKIVLSVSPEHLHLLVEHYHAYEIALTNEFTR